MEAPRLIPKKIEIPIHAAFMVWLLDRQLRIMGEVSATHYDKLPLTNGMDLTDTQWRDFRRGLPTLTIALVVFTSISLIVRRYLSPQFHSLFYACAGIGFVSYVHGAYALFIISLLISFFIYTKLFARTRGGKIAVWALAVSLLFLIDYNGGWYRGVGFFKSFFRQYQGVYRWHVGWNLVTLRLISFGCDYCEAYKDAEADATIKATWLPKHQTLCETCQNDTPCYTARQNIPLSLSEYSLTNLIAYVLYLPLYIAGPTTTFNSFVSHIHKPQKEYTKRYILFYLWRVCLLFSILEYGLRHYYVWALAKSHFIRAQMSPLEVALLGFYLLNALWLKFAAIWRYARLFALVDGIEVPENMTRCMNNNFTITGFWRNWHRSFNKWIVRYMYIPLGGRETQLLNVFPIFLFVSVWHDLELRLIKWGLLMAVFITPEVLISRYFNSPRSSWIRSRWFFRYLKATAGTFNISILMIANLIGFGSDGTDVFTKVTSLWWLIGLGFIEFFSATCLMIEVREWEAVQEASAKKL